MKSMRIARSTFPSLRVLLWIGVLVQFSTFSYAASGGGSYGKSTLLVDTNWLAQQIDEPHVRILDVRSLDEYQAGHVANAVNWPLHEVAITPNSSHPVTHQLLSKEQIESRLGLLGVNNRSTVVIYDDGTSTAATRVFWTLEYYGHSGKVTLLNGGFKRWRSENRQVALVVPRLERTIFRAAVDDGKLATKEYVLTRIGKPGITIVDARSAKEYTGEDRRGTRGGHIPGAVNIDWTNNLDSAAGVFKSATALEESYRNAAVIRGQEVIVYCQSGMRASHTYFTLRLLGYPRVRVYDGSWQEWGNDAALPVEGR